MKETKKIKFNAVGNTLVQIPTDMMVNNCIYVSYCKNAHINSKTQQKKISSMADILPILNINCSEVIIKSDIYYSCKTYNGLVTQPQVATVWSSQNIRTTKFNPLITRKKVFFVGGLFCFRARCFAGIVGNKEFFLASHFTLSWLHSSFMGTVMVTDGSFWELPLQIRIFGEEHVITITLNVTMRRRK